MHRAIRLNGAKYPGGQHLHSRASLKNKRLTVKVREPVTSRGFQHIHAVYVQVFFARMRDDPGETVAEHTGERAHEKNGTQRHEKEHEGRPCRQVSRREPA